MFRQVKSPAYGTGISANLVSSEERQKYNYGGRVGLVAGTGGNKMDYFKKKPMYPPSNPWQGPRNEYWTQSNLPDGVFPPKGRGQSEYLYDKIDYEEGLPKNLATMDYNIEGVSSKPYNIGEVEGGGTKRGDIFSSGYTGQGTGVDTLKNKYSVDISDMSLEEAQDIGRESDWWKMQKGDVFAMEATHDEETGEDTGYKYLNADTWVDKDNKLRSQKDLSDTEKMVMQKKFKEGKLDDTGESTIGNLAELASGKHPLNLGPDEIDLSKMPQPPKFDDTEMLDMKGIVDKYYDKKGSLGAAQLGLAGQILKAGFQPKKDAMGTVGDAMGQFGKSISEDKKAFEKLAATGEIQRELYRMSRAEEGKQDRATKAYDAKLKEWLKKNGADEDEISDIKSYTGLMAGWDTQKQGNMTALDHQDYVSRFNPELASSGITMDLVTDKKTQVTGFSEFDLQKFNEAEEGALIFVGNKMYIKNSSVKGSPGNPAGMEKTNYTQLTLSPKKKEKKKFKRFENI